jgi:hypothetical protein
VDKQVWYQVHNAGVAAAPANHRTELYLDGNLRAVHYVPDNLAPGERKSYYFDKFQWVCGEQQDEVTVHTDSEQKIPESNEQNNKCLETWKCDTEPPQIISGPKATDVETDEVKIEWTTDTPATGKVHYNTWAGWYGKEVSSAALVTQHMMVLKDLAPGTVYHYQVQSSDAAGNAVVSDGQHFRTKAPSDGQPPKMTSLATMGRQWPLEFRAEAEDQTGVARVEFYLEHQNEMIHIETDYSPPYYCHFNPEMLEVSSAEFAGTHRFIGEAHDLGGLSGTMQADLSHIHDCLNRLEVYILSPGIDGVVYTDSLVAPSEVIQIVAQAREFNGFEVRELPRGPWGGGTMLSEDYDAVQQVEFRVDGSLIATVTPPPEQFEVTQNYNVAGLALGSHSIWVTAQGNSGCRLTTIRRFEVRPREPALRLERNAVRNGNFIDVTLVVANVGSGTANLKRMRETMVGFQPTMADGGFYSVDHYEYVPADRQNAIEIDFNGASISLLPGREIEMPYKVVSILYNGFETYQIGGAAEIEFDDNYGVSHTQAMADVCPWVESGTNPRATVALAATEALATADYLIITNPRNLLGIYSESDSNQLLARLAELATLRNGALGYYHSYGSFTIHYDRNDGVAIGNIFGDLRQELMLADNDDDRIRIHTADSQQWIGGQLPVVFDGLHEDDRIAVGNVWTLESSSFAAHTRAEVVVADGHGSGEGVITIYRFFPGDGGLLPFAVDYGFRGGDGLTVGDVIGGEAFHPGDEILIARPDDDRIDVYQDQELTPALSISCTHFQSRGIIAAGNILGDAFDEIIIPETSRIWVYDGDNPAGHMITSIPRGLASADALAVGDVLGDDRDEILIADESDDRIYLYSYDVAAGRMQQVGDLRARSLHRHDDLAVADIVHGGKAEILIIRGHGTDNHSKGEVQVISWSTGETPGDRHALDDLSVRRRSSRPSRAHMI